MEMNAMYTRKVLDHFSNPRNVGRMDDADAVGIAGNPSDGDTTYIYVKVKDNVIDEITFQTMGCAAAIASSSMLTELAKGKTLDEAEQISRQDVADALDGLPDRKMECSNIAPDALQEALRKYRSKQG